MRNRQCPFGQLLGDNKLNNQNNRQPSAIEFAATHPRATVFYQIPRVSSSKITMILKSLLIYVLTSQIIVTPWVWWSICDEDHQSLERLKALTGTRRILCWSIGFGLQLLLAPFLLPWMLWGAVQCYRDARAEYQYFLELYMEIVLDPIHGANISDELREHFEAHTPSALSNRFDFLGDFYLKPEPYNSKARIFLAYDGDAFLEIGTTMETDYIEIISFLDNGDMISTASCAPISKTELFEQQGVHINAIDTFDVEMLLKSHADFLKQVSATSADVRKIDKEIWQDYYRYHNQKFGDARFEIGELKAPPEKVVFPQMGERNQG